MFFGNLMILEMNLITNEMNCVFVFVEKSLKDNESINAK